MPEPTSLIKNPLTIIATFATLAEVSGTAVLPLISSENQFYFMCFLMMFPTVLVMLFFGTLNFNHHVLYAPSDFKNEENYFKRFSKSSPLERSEKIREEVREIQTQNYAESTEVNISVPEIKHTPLDVSPVDLTPTNDIRMRYVRAEQLALRKIAKDWPEPVIPQMTLSLDNGRKILADAVSVKDKMATIFETKYYGTDSISPGQVKLGLKNLRHSFSEIPENVAPNICVVLIIVTDRKVPEDVQNRVVAIVQNDPNRFKYLSRIIFYNIEDMEREFGTGGEKAS